jgi:hypothetical protein
MQDPWRLEIFKPHAPYVLKQEELKSFLNRLASMKMPTCYCGVVVKHITGKKLGSMKIHNWHVLMQQLLPLAFRGLMNGNVRLCLMRLS